MKLAIAGVLALALAGTARAADLTLHLSSHAPGGTLAVAVFQDEAAFRRGEHPVAERIVPRTGAVTSLVIAGLTPGRYAVAAFHDMDGDGDLTLWPIGVPREAYGFSKDARGRFGPPPFAQAAFDLPASGATEAFALR